MTSTAIDLFAGLTAIDAGAGAAVAPEAAVDDLEALLAQHPDHLGPEDYPLVHRFAPGVYCREITMRPGIVVGRKHRTSHLNIISKGRVSFWVKGEPVRTVEAPYTFISQPGVRKVLYVHSETVWTTIHPTDETDLAVLDALLIEPPARDDNPLLEEPAL